MANGRSYQLEHLMEAASQEVAEKGLEASERAMTLACFKWLGSRVGNKEAPKKIQIALKVGSPLAIGAGLMAVLDKLVSALTR